MSQIIDAVKHVYYLNNGKEYDAVAMSVLQAYKRGGPNMATGLLQSPELHDDPAAKIMREYLGIKSVRPSKVIFSYCQPRRGGGAPEWGSRHAYRLNKWPSLTPYIHPTYVE